MVIPFSDLKRRCFRLDAFDGTVGQVAKESTKGTAAEMLNPKVQVYNGDVAVLTYNYAGTSIDKDGKTTPSRAESTRVFVKKDNKSVMVHANFGADPLPK